MQSSATLQSCSRPCVTAGARMPRRLAPVGLGMRPAGRPFLAPERLASFGPASPAQKQQNNITPSQITASSSAAAAVAPLQPAHPGRPADVFEALRRCRNLFSCLAFCAVYGFLSSGAGSSLPFASVAAGAVGDAGQHSECMQACAARVLLCDSGVPCIRTVLRGLRSSRSVYIDVV